LETAKRLSVPGLAISKTSSHAVEDIASGLIFVSGQVGVDEDGHVPDELSGQLRAILSRLDVILRGLNLDRSAILRTFTLVTDIGDFYGGGASDVWAEYVAANPPAATIAQVSALARPQFKIEIEATLARGRS
jgi:enamine deaminase RidA (YjgF/YER057c/UK114 family)